MTTGRIQEHKKTRRATEEEATRVRAAQREAQYRRQFHQVCGVGANNASKLTKICELDNNFIREELYDDTPFHSNLPLLFRQCFFGDTTNTRYVPWTELNICSSTYYKRRREHGITGPAPGTSASALYRTKIKQERSLLSPGDLEMATAHRKKKRDRHQKKMTLKRYQQNA